MFVRILHPIDLTLKGMIRISEKGTYKIFSGVKNIELKPARS